MHPGMEAAQVHGQGHVSVYSSPAPPSIHPVPLMGRPVGTPYSPTTPSLELKVYEINKRLRQRPEYADRWWWEQFACEFFDETATMVISYYSLEGEKDYTIGRQMIPQYFSSIFDGGVTEMYYSFSFPREFISQAGPTFECDSAVTTTQYLHPSYARVLVESRLSFTCTVDDAMRIRSWNQYLFRYKEYVPREAISASFQEGGGLDSLLTNVTHFGLNGSTLNFLNVSAIADTMRADVKPGSYVMPSGDCMQSWVAQRLEPPVPSPCMMSHPIANQSLGQPMADFTQSPVMSANNDSMNSSDRLCPTKSPKPAKKQKRVRKGATVKECSTPPKRIGKICTSNMTSTLPCPPITQQDVMIVGEPILMGGEVGEEDERRITRLENSNNTDFLASGHHQAISSTHSAYNGNGSNSSGFPLGVSNGEVYDEPSITAALDALEQDTTALSMP